MTLALESILGTGITSLIPCLMIGFIMLISFFCCDCEYLGKLVAKYFCPWKNPRRVRAKSQNEFSSSGQHYPSTTTSTPTPTTDRDEVNKSKVKVTTSQSALYRTQDVNEMTPSAPKKIEHEQGDFESDPPPSYEMCVKRK